MRPVDPQQAYERLDSILSRDEYQEYVSPVEWIVRAYTWFNQWFSSIPGWAQIVFIVVLVLILAAILAHLVWTVVRVWKGSGAAEPLAEPESVRSVRDLPAARKLLSSAAEALARNDRAEALRLYYLAVLASLRERGRIPLSTSLTGREILRRTDPPLTGLPEATSLFEGTVYGGLLPADEDVTVVRRLADGMGG